MSYTTLLYDLDGTLVSLETRYVNPIIVSVKEVLGDMPTENIQQTLSDLMKILGKKGFLLIPRTLWRLGRNMGMTRLQTLKFLYHSKKNYDENRFNFDYLDGAEQTLDYSLDHFNVIIITSAFEDELEVAIKDLSHLQKVDKIIGYHDVKQPKPDPEGILTVLKKFDLSKEECLFIGDLPSDMEAAKAAGIDKVAFTGTYDRHIRPLLEKYNPEYIVKNHDELLSLLKSFTYGTKASV